MARIDISSVKGIRPKKASQLLEYNEAVTAENVKTSAGELRPYYNYDSTVTLAARNLLRTFYKYSSTWLSWDADVNVVPAPVANDTSGTVYYTGDGLPKKTNTLSATDSNYGAGAQGSLPYSFLPLAVPQFLLGPTDNTSTGSGVISGFRCTIVSKLPSTGKECESIPSPASADIDHDGTTVDGIKLTLPNLIWTANTAYTAENWVLPSAAAIVATPTLANYIYKCVTVGTSHATTEPTWGTTIDADTSDGTAEWRCYQRVNNGSDILVGIRVYITAIGDEFSTWQRLSCTYSGTEYSTIPIAALGGNITATYTDDTGVVLGTLDYIPPPDALDNLVAMPGGMLAGNVGKDIYFCKPFFPHLFSEDIYTVKDNPIGLGVVDNTLIVGTDAFPATLTGSTPEAITIKYLPEANPCKTSRSIVYTPGGVGWATTNGLFITDGTTGTVITVNHFTRHEWDDYYPATFTAAYSDNKYFGFYDQDSTEGCVVIDIASGDITTLNLVPDSVFVDKSTDIMYYVVSTPEVILQEDGTPYPSQANVIFLEDGTSKILRE